MSSPRGFSTCEVHVAVLNGAYQYFLTNEEQEALAQRRDWVWFIEMALPFSLYGAIVIWAIVDKLT